MFDDKILLEEKLIKTIKCTWILKWVMLYCTHNESFAMKPLLRFWVYFVLIVEREFIFLFVIKITISSLVIGLKKTPIFHWFTCRAVIGQFVIGQIVIRLFVIGQFFIAQFVIRRFVIGQFVIGQFVIRLFVIGQFVSYRTVCY